MKNLTYDNVKSHEKVRKTILSLGKKFLYNYKELNQIDHPQSPVFIER